jgi:hypothetical protein
MLDHHPVFMKLAVERRRELLGCSNFAALPADRRVQLLDAVEKVRASLARDDELEAFSDQGKRVAEAATLKDALHTALAVLGQQRQIVVDMIEGLADCHGGSIDSAMVELRACKETLRRMLAIAESLEPEPSDGLQRRTRRQKGEARLLRSTLKDFGVEVALTTPDKHGPPNAGLVLMGLLANPPTSPDAIRKRLRR